MAVSKASVKKILDIYDDLIAQNKRQEANKFMDECAEAMLAHADMLLKKAKAVDAVKDPIQRSKLIKEFEEFLAKTINDELGLDKCTCTAAELFAKGCICGGN